MVRLRRNLCCQVAEEELTQRQSAARVMPCFLSSASLLLCLRFLTLAISIVDDNVCLSHYSCHFSEEQVDSADGN